MTKAMGFVSALIFALGTVPAARAQLMLDVSKITCDQFAGYKIPLLKISRFGWTATITASEVTQSSICKSLLKIRRR